MNGFSLYLLHKSSLFFASIFLHLTHYQADNRNSFLRKRSKTDEQEDLLFQLNKNVKDTLRKTRARVLRKISYLYFPY